MRHWLVIVITWALAGPVSAQVSPTPPQPAPALPRPLAPPMPPPAATPEQLAAANTEASRLIAEAKAERYFEAAPPWVNSASFQVEARIRHRVSGAICTFPLGQAGARIELLRTAAEPGEDFVCHSQTSPDERMTTHVVRYPETPTLDHVLQVLEQSMRRGLVDAKPISLPRSSPAIRFQGVRDGAAVIEAAAADIVGGWVVEQRQTVPLATGRLAIARGDFAFTRLVRNLSPPGAGASQVR